MLKSVLLHLNGVDQSQAVIEVGMQLAQRSRARVRGVTMVDTRRIEALASSCESAVYMDNELGRIAQAEKQQTAVCTRLSQACLAAEVDFDVRRISGDPFDILPGEAQYHDLVISAHAAPDAKGIDGSQLDVSGADLIGLIERGVQPMLIVRSPLHVPSRVLMIYDGTAASGRSVRSFIGQNLFPNAEFRLLIVADAEERARHLLQEMVDYCRARRLTLETGYAVGSQRRIVIPFARKWQADMLVLGVTRGNRMFRRFFRGTAQRVLSKTDLSLYASG
jgi:nucleotide-binding universal stress UspA family protein